MKEFWTTIKVLFAGVGGWHLFAYDTKRAMWHREDSRIVVQFAACKGDLYAMDGMGVLWTAGGTEGTEEPELQWSATSGVIGYTNAENKYVSRFNIRMQMPRGSSMDVYLQYDSDGIWHHHGHIRGKGIYSFVLPIRPRRCDHFLLRVEGKGECKIYSIAKILEIGSDMCCPSSRNCTTTPPTGCSATTCPTGTA